MSHTDLVRELEQENKFLRNDVFELNQKISTLTHDNTELQHELNEYCDNFNSDEETIEKIHLLYYDVCEMVDNGNTNNVFAKLQDFFKRTIDKEV
jgi:chromosome segregation ATPase